MYSTKVITWDISCQSIDCGGYHHKNHTCNQTLGNSSSETSLKVNGLDLGKTLKWARLLCGISNSSFLHSLLTSPFLLHRPSSILLSDHFLKWKR